MSGRAIAGALLLGLAPAAAAVGPGLPPFGLGAFDRAEPISITADQLEARDQRGRRTLAFRRNVEVRQGSLGLTAQVLEAEYVSGERQPRHLHARGGVRIREGTRRAHCARAHYDRVGQSILCSGEPAELWDGNDRLTGREIAFDLAGQSVQVAGGTRVEVRRDLGELDFGEATPDAAILEQVRERGPITIHAAELDASDPGGERRIRFRGDVRLVQDGVELRAAELEAVYPPGASRPDRLVAERDVVLTEGSREARCARAEYRPDDRLVTCEGDALLRDREDRLAGDRIAFDLDSNHVDAVGRTRLWVDRPERGGRDR